MREERKVLKFEKRNARTSAEAREGRNDVKLVRLANMTGEGRRVLDDEDVHVAVRGADEGV